jgi:modulator of drug activity B
LKNILIINAHQKYPGKSEGNLTQTLIDSASEILNNNGYKIKYTHIENGYEVKEELEKFQWADGVIFQYPVYWMHMPWTSKKYIDEVFSGGKLTVTFKSDGRSESDPSKRYGTGGLLGGKKYMLSMTYNCPMSEFDNDDSFYEGLSLDQANVAVHKVFQFCGMSNLQSHAVHDVHKAGADITSQIERFKEVVKSNFL